jgi:hypothetical protein
MGTADPRLSCAAPKGLELEGTLDAGLKARSTRTRQTETSPKSEAGGPAAAAILWIGR